jgi:hypothetical protein
MISSAGAPIRRPSSSRSRRGTSTNASSLIRCGASFAAKASPAASVASRGSGPWCAAFSQMRPSKPPKASA